MAYLSLDTMKLLAPYTWTFLSLNVMVPGAATNSFSISGSNDGI